MPKNAVSVFVCGPGERCESANCGEPAQTRCAFVTKRGPCNRKLCERCRHGGAKSRPLCPAHHNHLARGGKEFEVELASGVQRVDPQTESLEHVRRYNLLLALLDGTQLSQMEREVFQDFVKQIDTGRELSPKQKEWVDRVARQIEQHNLDALLLITVIDKAEDPDPFIDMLQKLGERGLLTEAQREWAMKVESE